MNFKEWLNLRYDADCQSRNQRVQEQVLGQLKEDTIRILDIGAGTGSNIRYLLTKLTNPKQQWILLDQEEDLLQNVKHHLAILADLQHQSDAKFAFHYEGREISVEFLVGDLFSSKVEAYMKSSDLIVANAFFDLLSKSQLSSFMSMLKANEQLLLATINYTGTTFSVHHSKQDDIWIERYHQHMKRPSLSGSSTGPDCINEMTRIIQDHGLRYVAGPSDWVLDLKEPLIQGIFDFMEAAFLDMGMPIEEFNNWRTSKREGELVIHHSDLAILC